VRFRFTVTVDRSSNGANSTGRAAGRSCLDEDVVALARREHQRVGLPDAADRVGVLGDNVEAVLLERDPVPDVGADVGQPPQLGLAGPDRQAPDRRAGDGDLALLGGEGHPQDAVGAAKLRGCAKGWPSVRAAGPGVAVVVSVPPPSPPPLEQPDTKRTMTSNAAPTLQDLHDAVGLRLDATPSRRIATSPPARSG
jgi:hypothetical protein